MHTAGDSTGRPFGFSVETRTCGEVSRPPDEAEARRILVEAGQALHAAKDSARRRDGVEEEVVVQGLRVKLAGEKPTDAQLDAIVAAIDDAVAKIEKA